MKEQPACYRPLFERTRARVEAKGIPVALEYGPEVSSEQIDDIERQWGTSFPVSLRLFYLEIGNGFSFHWFRDRSIPMQPFCCLNVPRLVELQEMMAYLQVLHEAKADWDFSETECPRLAKCNYQREGSFVPFLRDNADLVCIETRGSEETVVFWDHEWDAYKNGDRGDSGILLADSLLDFWRGWASVDLVEPRHFWWPGAIVSRGVEWTAEHFEFCT